MDWKDLVCQDFGLKVNEKGFLVVANTKDLPSLRYVESKGLFCLMYKIPKCLRKTAGEGLNYFYFDGNVFCNAYHRSFQSLFFEQFYSNANFVVRFIFEFFRINPTLLHYAFSQDKRRRKKSGFTSKLIVEPKIDKIRRFWGLGKENVQREGKNAKKGQKNEFEMVYSELDRVQKENLDMIVAVSAREYDLNYFADYLTVLLSSYAKLKGKYVGFFPKSLEKKLFEKYQNDVLDLQKNASFITTS